MDFNTKEDFEKLWESFKNIFFSPSRTDFATWTRPSSLHVSRATRTSRLATNWPSSWRSLKTAPLPWVSTHHIARLFSIVTASTTNLLVVSVFSFHSDCVRYYPSRSQQRNSLVLFFREHCGWSGPCCACSGIWHPEWRAILAHQELLVHILGQWWLHPHVYEG